jgi:plastocyanin
MIIDEPKDGRKKRLRVVNYGRLLLFSSLAGFTILLVAGTAKTTTLDYIQMVNAQNTSTALPSPSVLTNSTVPSSTSRIFYLYTTEVSGFNETKGVKESGLVSDQFSLQTLTVNQGDKVSVNFYNMEDESGDRHSFTIDAPYKVNIDIAPGQNGTANFDASHPGIFKFYCKYHQPSMAGELVVLAGR